MTIDNHADVARAVAIQLDSEYAEPLPALVERELAGKQPDQYFEPVSVGSLIVAAASLAWTIYNSRRKKNTPPTVQVIIREVRIGTDRPAEISAERYDQIIETTAHQVLEQALISTEGEPENSKQEE